MKYVSMKITIGQEQSIKNSSGAEILSYTQSKQFLAISSNISLFYVHMSIISSNMATHYTATHISLSHLIDFWGRN